MWTLRRAKRGLHEIVRIKRLGLHTALPRYFFALYQPELSELLQRAIGRVLGNLHADPPAAARRDWAASWPSPAAGAPGPSA